MLTYRESKALDEDGRAQIKRARGRRPASRCAPPCATASRPGLPRRRRSDLVAYNLLLLAHAWALKHWYFERTKTLESYIQNQLALNLRAILRVGLDHDYADLLNPDR